MSSDKSRPQTTVSKKTSISSSNTKSTSLTGPVAMGMTQGSTADATAREQPFAGHGLQTTTSDSSLHVTQSDSALFASPTNLETSDLLSRIAIHRPKRQGELGRRRSKALRRSIQETPSK